VNVFELDQALINDYERFARSFTQIRAADIKSQVDAIYATDRFWPKPLVTINPNFERSSSIESLVTDGSISAETAKVFHVDGRPITLYRHQAAVGGALSSPRPDAVRDKRRDYEVHEGRMQTGPQAAHVGETGPAARSGTACNFTN
jgi:hypothetical protein